VLQRAVPDGSHLTDLADQAQITKQGATVLVDQLERLGCVRRVPDSSDGRAQLIVIEQNAPRAVEVAKATLDEILSEWKTYLGARNFSSGTRSSINSARSPTLTRAEPGPARPPSPLPAGSSSVSADGAGRRSTLV
jgi:hypothetical protein